MGGRRHCSSLRVRHTRTDGELGRHPMHSRILRTDLRPHLPQALQHPRGSIARLKNWVISRLTLLSPVSGSAIHAVGLPAAAQLAVAVALGSSRGPSVHSVRVAAHTTTKSARNQGLRALK